MRVNDLFGVIGGKPALLSITNSLSFIPTYKGITELDYFLEKYLHNKHNRISVKKTKTNLVIEYKLLTTAL